MAAEATVAVPRPMSANDATTSPAATETRRERRTAPVRELFGESFAGVAREKNAERRVLRKRSDDNDQADPTVGPPSEDPEVNNRLRRTSGVPGDNTLELLYKQ